MHWEFLHQKVKIFLSVVTSSARDWDTGFCGVPWSVYPLSAGVSCSWMSGKTDTSTHRVVSRSSLPCWLVHFRQVKKKKSGNILSHCTNKILVLHSDHGALRIGKSRKKILNLLTKSRDGIWPGPATSFSLMTTEWCFCFNAVLGNPWSKTGLSVWEESFSLPCTPNAQVMYLFNQSVKAEEEASSDYCLAL